ncbi:MAG: TIGR04255 family protein [Pseudomonadota bacterium]
MVMLMSFEKKPGCAIFAVRGPFRKDQLKMPDPSGDRNRDYPIRDVVALVGYPAEPVVECHRHKFFHGIRDRYSVAAPLVVDYDNPTAFPSYRFEDPDKGAAVFLSAESLGYATTRYDGFAQFRKAFLSLVDLLGATFEISELTRVALWYTNVLPFERKHDAIPLSRFLKVGMSLPKEIPAKYLDVNINFTIPAGKGFLEVAVQPRYKDFPEPQEAIFLTLKYEMRQKIGILDVSKHLDDAHEETQNHFRSLINQTYWKSLEKKGAR